MYQTGDTIRKTLDEIQRHDLVLPAIQREFVWRPGQICRLFDSLMQGYRSFWIDGCSYPGAPNWMRSSVSLAAVSLSCEREMSLLACLGQITGRLP